MNIDINKIKKEKLKLIILIISLVVIITSATYAFFVSSVSSPAITDASLESERSQNLIFTPGSPINLTASLANFAEGDGSLSASTSSNANLKASASIGSATENYYIYFNITENTFVYSQNESTPELILTVTDPDGNEVTNIPGLNHTTVTDALTGDDITGFDVTTHKGNIAIKKLQEISTTDSTTGTTQDWSIKLTFVNLDVPQTLNEGKNFTGELILRIDEYSEPLSEAILYNNGGIDQIESRTTPNFSQIATTNEGMYAAEDDYGTSYYFRGAVDNNWVKFANYYWKIIRINGDGSVRMIYSGTVAPSEIDKVYIKNSSVSIATERFDNFPGETYYKGAEYTGYMYTANASHGNTNNSNIKNIIDNWYLENIENKGLSNHLSDTLFCADRVAYTDINAINLADGYGTTVQFFAARVRLQTYKTPTYICQNKEDSFTVSDKSNGNGSLMYPVALITADEIAYAGASYHIISNIYLNGSGYYFSMTPYYRGTSEVSLFGYNQTLSLHSSFHEMEVRPVISLKHDVPITGNGTWNNPYVVK